MFNSLIWLEDSTYTKLPKQVIMDLGLETFYTSIIEEDEANERIVNRLCTDLKTIRYRQDIVRDLMEQPKLSDYLVENLASFSELVFKFSKTTYDAENLYFLIELVIVVEESIICLENLYGTLSGYDFKAEGLRHLKQVVSDQVGSHGFKEMKQDLREIREAFSHIKSAEIKVNMNLGMRPVEAQVTKLLDHKTVYPQAFRKVAMVASKEGTFLNQYLSQYIPVFTIKNIHLDLKEELEYGLRDYGKILKYFLNKYSKVDPMPYVQLYREIAFYQSGLALLQEMASKKLPMSIPELLPMSDRSIKLEGAYNVNLTRIVDVESVVLNDFSMDSQGRIIILTGANSGGKTTFTQALGQIQVLAQMGLMVPAKKAKLSLTDGIFTHFQVLEKETINLGRLGKECEDFSAIYKQASDASLLLMNESFASTSHLESLTIAAEVIKACKYRQVRTIFNTHLHELYGQVSGLNETMDNDCKIISLVSGEEEDVNSFKLHFMPPLGKSYADRIAKSYGITYKQLMARLKEVK